MDWDSIRAAIETYLQANWNDTPIAWENLIYKPTAGAAWIRSSIKKAGNQRETLTGSPATGHKYYGSLMISIFTPANTGVGLADRLMDRLNGLFREKQIPLPDGGELSFGDKAESFESEETHWYQLNWSIPFEGERI